MSQTKGDIQIYCVCVCVCILFCILPVCVLWCQDRWFHTIIAEAVKTGTGAALIHINFTAGAGEALQTVTVETQREMVLIQLFLTHCTVLAGISGLTGEELTIMSCARQREMHLDFLFLKIFILNSPQQSVGGEIILHFEKVQVQLFLFTD